MKITVIALLCLLVSGAVMAQETTPEPTPTETPMPTPAVYAVWTLEPPDSSTDGQEVLFTYTADAGQAVISMMLAALLFSLWMMFVIALLIHRSRR